jgi:hypothetical protein
VSEHHSADALTTRERSFTMQEQIRDVAGAWQAIDELEFDRMKAKLLHRHDGGWTPETVTRAELGYRQFLKLSAKYPTVAIVPGEEVDQFWHAHILDTQRYAPDCERIFGYVLHHNPYVGIDGAEDEARLFELAGATSELMAREFGTALGVEAKAAYCAITPGAEAKPAYCAITPGLEANPAYCAITPGVEAKPAYCAITPGVGAKPAYCAITPGVGAKPAYCAITPGVGAKPAYCAITPGMEAKPAYCAITPGMRAEPAYCAAPPAHGGHTDEDRKTLM